MVCAAKTGPLVPKDAEKNLEKNKKILPLSVEMV
jgi:hypothetical protein